MKKLILFTLFTPAVLLLFGFIGWILSSHGAIGLFRFSIFLYILIFICVFGITLIGLFLWYWRFNRSNKGTGGNRLYIFLFSASLICIALFSFGFSQFLDFSHAENIKPIPQLSLPHLDKDNLHFAVGSDAHFGTETSNTTQTLAMLDQISNPANKYDAFFFLGDLVEYGFKNNQWSEASQAFTPVAAHVPIRFAPGNHDTLFGGISRYLNYCGQGTAESQNNSDLWYRVDIGNVHFLVLDLEWSTETYTKDQADWLETQLKDIPEEDWKIIMSHGFYYSSGTTLHGWDWFDNPETITGLTPLFEKYGVDIVFSGHNHYLEFLQHSGVSYVVCGGFGGKLDPIATYLSPSSIWHQAGHYGFTEVNLIGNQIILNFRDPDYAILKSITIIKP
ncbi:MAG: metallophosphoesterase [Dehalococcoidales bacterium]|nr:metallophosphoesterase [Dehalococcoidales bacterium]